MQTSWGNFCYSALFNLRDPVVYFRLSRGRGGTIELDLDQSPGKCTLLYFTLLYYFILLYFTLLYFTLLYFTLLYFSFLYFTLLYFTLIQKLFLDIKYLFIRGLFWWVDLKTLLIQFCCFPGAKDPGWPLDTRPGSSPMSGLNYKSYLPRLLEKLQKKY